MNEQMSKIVNSDREKLLEAFENMLSSVQHQYEDIEVRMTDLKMEGKEKTTTYRQLMANKLRLGDMLAMYKLYDLL